MQKQGTTYDIPDWTKEIKEKEGLPLVGIGYGLMGLAALGEITAGEFNDISSRLLEKINLLEGEELREGAELASKMSAMTMSWGG